MRNHRTHAIVAALVLAAAVALASAWLDVRDPPDRSATVPARAPKQLAARRQVPIPVRIVIPAISVDARVVKLGLNPDHTMQVPANLADTGWFQPGPEPGETGAAVIVGHLNARSGPGVFSHLSSLRPGNVITVRLRDGSRVQYVARSRMRVAKSRFPTDLVYAKTARPTLRLITCAGTLDPVTGHHADNYIVFASLLRAPA